MTSVGASSGSLFVKGVFQKIPAVCATVCEPFHHNQVLGCLLNLLARSKDRLRERRLGEGLRAQASAGAGSQPL